VENDQQFGLAIGDEFEMLKPTQTRDQAEPTKRTRPRNVKNRDSPIRFPRAAGSALADWYSHRAKGTDRRAVMTIAIPPNNACEVSCDDVAGRDRVLQRHQGTKPETERE